MIHLKADIRIIKTVYHFVYRYSGICLLSLLPLLCLDIARQWSGGFSAVFGMLSLYASLAFSVFWIRFSFDRKNANPLRVYLQPDRVFFKLFVAGLFIGLGYVFLIFLMYGISVLVEVNEESKVFLQIMTYGLLALFVMVAYIRLMPGTACLVLQVKSPIIGTLVDSWKNTKPIFWDLLIIVLAIDTPVYLLQLGSGYLFRQDREQMMFLSQLGIGLESLLGNLTLVFTLVASVLIYKIRFKKAKVQE